MKQLMIAALALVTLSSGSALYAKTTGPAKHVAKKTQITRAEKARRQVAADLHLRGSNIPPAFSATGAWSR